MFLLVTLIVPLGDLNQKVRNSFPLISFVFLSVNIGESDEEVSKKLVYFEKEKITTQAAKKFCDVYGHCHLWQCQSLLNLCTKLVDFSKEILMSKMCLVLITQLRINLSTFLKKCSKIGSIVTIYMKIKEYTIKQF